MNPSHASLAEEATEFYSLPELRGIVTQERQGSMLQSIAVDGSYTHTPSELLVGARLAWRSQPRCVGRYNWHALEVIDARSCVTAKDVAEACWNHLRISTNRGKVRPMVTVFRRTWVQTATCAYSISRSYGTPAMSPLTAPSSATPACRTDS